MSSYLSKVANVNLPSICWLIIVQLWRPEVARRWKNHIFEVLSQNDSLLGNFQNYVPKEFIATPLDVLCSNFVKFGRRKIDKNVRCLPGKKKQNLAWLSSSHYCTDRAQNLPRPAWNNVLRFHTSRSTFGGVIPERANTIKTGCKVFPIFGWSLALSRVIMEMRFRRIIGLPPAGLFRAGNTMQFMQCSREYRIIWPGDWCCIVAIEHELSVLYKPRTDETDHCCAINILIQPVVYDARDRGLS